MVTGPEQSAQVDVVELSVPAEASYVAVVRLAAVGLAARAELTVDDVEDLRLAVDEACALVLPHLLGPGPLAVRFEIEHGSVAARVSVAALPAAEIDLSGFTWTVLTALASTVQVTNESGRLAIELTRRRQTAHR